MDEISDITDYIQQEAGSTADVIWGHGYDESLGDKLCVTIIATGFNTLPHTGLSMKAPKKNKMLLEEEANNEIIKEDVIPSFSDTVEEVKEETTIVDHDYEDEMTKYVLNEDQDLGLSTRKCHFL